MPTEPKAERKHSPLPWNARKMNPDTIESTDGYMTAHVRGSTNDSVLHNRDLIIRAVNTHQMLVEALQAALEALYNVPCVGEAYDQQHSDTHMRATRELTIALSAVTAEREGGK